MAKFETDKKRVVTFLTKPLEEMSLKLIEEKGYINHQDVILHAIRSLYSESFPAYTQKQPSQRLNRTPQERAEDEVNHKKAKAEIERNEKLGICEVLGGTVVGNSCEYRVFTKKYGTKIHEGVVTVALDTLAEDHIEKQFDNTTPEECKAQGLM